jgi:hypothetical protein
MSNNFIQHNPTIADGPEGVKALVQMLASPFEMNFCSTKRLIRKFRQG